MTGPMGRRVLRFDGPLGRGLWYRPTGDEYICRFAALYVGAEGAVPPQRQQGFITTLGGALKQSGRRQPVPDRTLGAQGRQPRRLHHPSRRSRVNLWKYSLPPSPLERSEHNPFIQPAAKRRPLFAFGNTVCLMSSRQLVFTAIYLKPPVYRDSSPGVRMTRPAGSRQRIADSGWPTADRGQQNSPISLRF